jgi:gliding motility-associated-like protein
MKIRYIILLSWFCVNSMVVFAQGEANIWYFGDFAGLDFSSGSPVVLTDGQTNTQEGVSVCSNSYGVLMFYTDGVTVWTKNHTAMSNGTGLHGHSSSTQSSMIALMPGSVTEYYVFTTDYAVGNRGMKYSIVDMELNNGLGAVTLKNISIHPSITERMALVAHGNGFHFWLITQLRYTNHFLAYLVTENGISSNPVITQIGNDMPTPLGWLRVSDDGSLIVSSKYQHNLFELYTFNNLEGTVSNPIIIEGYDGVYGSEFSPDGTKLYVLLYPTRKIFQFDVSNLNKESIANSGIYVGTSSGNWGGALQLAPDGKIYVARQHDWDVGVPTIGVINYPNLSGTACNFVDQAINLQSGRVRLGLPNFVFTLNNIVIEYETDCFGDSTYFWIESNHSIDSAIWNFGDPASGAANISTLINPYHVFSSPGNYLVSVTVYSGMGTVNGGITVEIIPSPEVSLGPDTTLCTGEVLLLEPGNGFVTYLWQDGSEEETYMVNDTGLYWVEVANDAGCLDRDSIFITFLQGPEIWLGNDSTVCSGDTIQICVDPGYQEYFWQDGSTEACFAAVESGTYWVRVINENGCEASDTINLVFLPGPDLFLGNDTVICFNQTFLLDAGWGYDNYLWQDGSDGQTYEVVESGSYWVIASGECGTGNDTIQIIFSEYFEIFLGNDTSFCYGHSLLLDPGNGFNSYIWNNGSTLQTTIASTTGYHWVAVTDSLGCIATDSIYINVYMDHQISIGDDTVKICEGSYIFFDGPSGYVSYVWQDGSVLPSLFADTAGIYWLEVTDEQGCAGRDTVVLQINSIPEGFLGDDLVLCPDGEITITVQQDYEVYVWHDGSDGNEFITNLPGKFWVTVKDEIGCTGSDTIMVLPFSPPTLNLEPLEYLCEGDSLILAAGEGHVSYLWQDGSQNSYLSVEEEGMYRVIVETACGHYADTVQVIFYQGNLDLGNDTVLFTGETLLLYPGPAYSDHNWNTGSTESTLFVDQEGTYWLNAFDGYCYISDTIKVQYYSDIWVPNVFTPNNDGYNDSFYAVTSYPEGIFDFRMTIFNRWGKILFTMDKVYDQWDGTVNGSDAAEGVYFWTCEYTTFGSSDSLVRRIQRGSVTLIR